MPCRFLTHDDAQAFYDRFGSKQDRQHWYASYLTTCPLTDEGRKSTELAHGTTAAFAAHLEHRVEATQDSDCLIVMGGQG